MKSIASILTLLLCVGAAACGKSKGSNSETNEQATAAKPDINFDGPSMDWSKQALTKVSDTVDGMAFSIELPGQLEREEKKNDGTFPGYVTWNGPNPFMDPTFTAQEATFPPADRAAAEASALRGSEPRELLHSADLEGGGFVVSVAETSKQFLSVQAWKTAASSGKVVRFSIGLRTKDPMDNLDALRIWMETIVSSFDVQ